MTPFDKAVSDFRTSLWRVMQVNRIDVDWIARRIGLSKTNFMQRVFKSNHNFRLDGLVKLAEAVSGRLRVEVVPIQSDSELTARKAGAVDQ